MISKQKIKTIIKTYPSCYLADADKFEKNYLRLKKAFSKYWDNFNIAYSYKTNYLPSFCTEVKNLGGFAEVVSEMELELALRLGVENRRIIWNGPIKNQTVLEKFILNGGHFNVDNVNEFEFILKLSRKYPKNTFAFGLRVNFDIGDGLISRFGVDYPSKDFDYILKTVNLNPNLRLAGLHCHFAKRNIEYWPNRVEGIINIISRENLKPDYIDLGGGLFGELEKSFADQLSVKSVKYSDYASSIFRPFKHFFKNKKHPLVLIEPGTAIVADSMFYLTTVSSIKKVREKTFITLHGSQKNISMSGINPPIKTFHFSKRLNCVDDADMVGYTCIENDVLFRHFSGLIGLNDVICFSNCGSYSIVMKPPFIFPNCPVFLLKKGDVKLVKREETFEDVFATYLFHGEKHE